MPAQPINIETRINALSSVLAKKAEQQAVSEAFIAANGDWTAAAATLTGKLPDASLQKVALAHSLAVWSGDNVSLVSGLANQADVSSLRDVALHYNVAKLTALVNPKDVPANIAGATDDEKKHNFVVTLQHQLFTLEPTAVLQRMVQENEVPIANDALRGNVVNFLANQPDFNIRTTSVYAALQKPDAFKGIAEDQLGGVVAQLKTLQRVQAISPVPEAVPMLMQANLTSAFSVAEMPESTFLNAYSNILGEDTARQVYTNAINSHIRNEQALMTMRESMRGTGLAIIDGQQTLEERVASLQQVADKQGVPLNLEALFGSMDYCECEECTSVYSPAAYFVDLLQFLRNNDLDPDTKKFPNTGQKGITGTPLEKLFRRRPDLGCLELTCQNTNTVLPYIDLVNEVMESFVVHLGNYHADPNDPKQAQLEVFNVEDETTSELLAQPQHINYDAYCTLKSAVYPFTLPYHQPIDATRIFLKYLGTSRYELLDTYREAVINCSSLGLTQAGQQELQALQTTILDRAVDAEFLGLTQEEYIILTKEAFWPKRYFEITQKKDFTEDDYRQHIGVKQPYEYYGYSTEADMLSMDEAQAKGLTFVKKQFLPRTGIQYVDLVELLKTRFINPGYPQGQALTLMESIRFSYRFLQTLLDNSSTDPKVRFSKLIAFLEQYQPLVPLMDAMLHPDPCQQQKPDWCVESKELRNWVYCYFDAVGKLIVLESGEGPQLPIEGQLFRHAELLDPFVGTLYKDGIIVDKDGRRIGSVTINGQVITSDGKSFVEKYGFLSIKNEAGKWIGFIDGEGIHGQNEQLLTWLPTQDTCDLEKVRLMHLDGTVVTVDEYDRMQCFIRLWHKMGWTIDETDKALIGLSTSPTGTTVGTSSDCDYVSFDAFQDSCPRADANNGGSGQQEDWNCPDPIQVSYDITPDFLRQLVAVRKLLDLTGLSLPRLLTFWADISTTGEQSLYASLFLTHNLLGIDKVFKADANGNYLTQMARLSDHIPVLMAVLRLKADDITAIMSYRQLPDSLTLQTVSTLYRSSLLMKALHLKVTDLPELSALFGDPFKNAYQTLTLFETWGKMEDAGFTFRQLDYIIRDHDDAQRPLAPPKKTILQLSKTLYDGLNGIQSDQPDITAKDQATDELVRAKAGLLYEQTIVEQIIGLLEGTTVYTTNAPANLTITIPDTLSKKLKYTNQQNANPPAATIQVTGIFTAAEQAQAKGLSSHPDWPKAIDRVEKQTLNVFNDVLTGIFPDVAAAKTVLLAGDVNLPADQRGSNVSDTNTTPVKSFYFLQSFMPFLRKQLTHRFIITTMASAASLTSDVTDVLLSDILVEGTAPSAQPVISALENITAGAGGSTGSWKGYLIPPTNDMYTFVAISDTQPAPLLLDGQSIPFTHQQEDPSNVWSTDPTSKLKSGNLYALEVTDRPATRLQWKTTISAKAPIPTSALLPDYSSQGTEEAFTKLFKAALLVNGFSLTADEVSYWQSHSTDFDDFDFNAVTLKQWQRLQAYTDLRNNLPKTDTSLLDLFKWTSKPDAATKLSQYIAAATLWKQENIDKLLTKAHFDLNRLDAFRNEVNLVKLQKALTVADKIGVDIDLLFEWARPTSKYWLCHKIAEDIRKALRARYDQEDWEKVVQPLNDQLREDQKQALISYLLVQQDLIDWSVVDADGLFEFFLIDVQMDACMETSRIKQAISTVQLFVQRCLLGLEEQYGVPNDSLDRDRWEWMQKYRVWEANRKVFLYPENWIDPQLRDDKSPFYKELESDLLQKDINTQTVEDALKNYLFKVDEVANLKVVGLFLEQDFDKDDKPKLDKDGNVAYIKLHVFSRTRNAPYLFYYRYFQVQEQNWYPWEKVQVDIPSYDVEDEHGQITENGTYLVPMVWNRRLLIFFPQFMKKTAPSPASDTKFKDLGDAKSGAAKPAQYWEIKMAWSEYRNGKWTQKQVSAEAINDPDPTKFPAFDPAKIFDAVPGVNNYDFLPRLFPDPDSKVVIDIYRGDKNAIGAFSFAGSQLSRDNDNADWINLTTAISANFQYTNKTEMHSLQASNAGDPPLLQAEPYFDVPNTSVTVHKGRESLPFYHPFVHQLLGKLATGNLDNFFSYYLNKVTDKADAFGADPEVIYHELKRTYSLYNWEAGFHAPMQLVILLRQSQLFDQALNMCHYVFNPLAPGSDKNRFWEFPPFREVNADSVLETLFMGLRPGQSKDVINEWREKPFQPHVVARSRPSAYMKWVVMTYIQILIDYGDYYFRQNTLETIPLAIQCYVLAAHLYGPRGQKIPKRGLVKPETYNSLLDKWDAFSNAMVELELVFPFSNQTPFPVGKSNGVVGLANIFGFATTLYFCIPDNPQLMGIRDTIDDRLFKIRHCQDINGVFRQLPLFEPPIEPGLLVQAVAQGLSISSVLNDLNSPMPNYRFYYLLQKALELCTELKAFGNAFLSVKEKEDAEALSVLRATQETSIQNLIMEVKKQQLDEANKSLDALQQSRKTPVYRMQYYLQLIGEDLSKVPDDATDFSELAFQIETPVDESGLKLVQYEKEEMDKAGEAKDSQVGIGLVETLGSILNIIPNFSGNIEPFGVGASISFGGSNLGSAAQAVARGLQIHANDLSYQSTNSGRKGGFLRQLQDRVQQANMAGYEIKNIDKQILAQNIRISIANQEITNQQKQIDNAQEVADFLRDKYTNQELYSWMEGQIRTLYYQAYTLAYDLAKKAEKVFRFERGLTTSNFIQFGYWDAAHDGLLTGERLYIGLKQLEAAYQEKRAYDYEVVKPISLRQVNPLALIQLKETGACEFSLPEVLFDMDYPGHYMRRIKSVALSVPCVVGPYTSLNCTLRLLEHKFRTSAIAKDKNDYLEKTDETDERFSTTNIPITSIAVSTGQNDSGMFELNFRDERYIPFEGAGVMSKWRLELPDQFRQFDYDTITDVIIQLRYTAVDGGDKLKKPAGDSALDYIKSVEQLSQQEGLFASFDLKHDFSSEWYKAMQPPAGATERVLMLNNLNERLPIFTRGREPDKIIATDIYLFTSTNLSSAALTLIRGTDEITFTDEQEGKIKLSVAKEKDCPVTNWQLKIQDVNTKLEKMWLLVRYVLK